MCMLFSQKGRQHEGSRASSSVNATTATTDGVKSDGGCSSSSSSKKLPWNDPNNRYKVDWDRFEAVHPKDRPMDHNKKKRPRPECYTD
ncbi:hypothetical protein PG994_001707 [Apiospora phragmitis]|uniref:Uncharacterized protein n=1 Tax=Apiospora phragmitis TaxID=2905665 RepID=A0ABR1WU81_9PEZI